MALSVSRCEELGALRCSASLGDSLVVKLWPEDYEIDTDACAAIGLVDDDEAAEQARRLVIDGVTEPKGPTEDPFWRPNDIAQNTIMKDGHFKPAQRDFGNRLLTRRNRSIAFLIGSWGSTAPSARRQN